MIIPIILAGGEGKRLWPLSNEEHPKQFLSLVNNKSLLQNTLSYIANSSIFSPPIIVCNQKHRAILEVQIKQIMTPSVIIVEPEGRNTAGAVVTAALYAQKTFGDEHLLLVLPTDLHIADNEYFDQMIQSALSTALLGKIAIFGVPPSKPHPGYGYIKKGEVFDDSQGYTVEKFIEKPSFDTATQYVASGDYYWNSGIFLFKVSTLLKEAYYCAENILVPSQEAVANATVEPHFLILSADYIQCPKISLDLAIIEKSTEIVVFPFLAKWIDLGDWEAVWELSAKDKENNTIQGHIISKNTENSYLYSQSGTVITLGVKNMVIVQLPNLLLVADINQTEELKKILDKME